MWSPVVVVGWICVGSVGGRREVKSVVWARARAEARVPMWRVRRGSEEEKEVVEEIVVGV